MNLQSLILCKKATSEIHLSGICKQAQMNNILFKNMCSKTFSNKQYTYNPGCCLSLGQKNERWANKAEYKEMKSTGNVLLFMLDDGFKAIYFKGKNLKK